MLRLYRKGSIGEEELEQQLGEIRREQEMVLATKLIEQKRLEGLRASRQKLNDLENALTKLQDSIDHYSFEQRRELVRLIVPGDELYRIIVGSNKSLTVNGVIDFESIGEQELPPPLELSSTLCSHHQDRTGTDGICRMSEYGRDH